MVHEIITLPETGVELETYLTDNRAVEPGRRKPLALIFPGGCYAWRSDREAEPVALRLQSLGIQAIVVRYSVAPARHPKPLLEAAEAVAETYNVDGLSWRVTLESAEEDGDTLVLVLTAVPEE